MKLIRVVARNFYADAFMRTCYNVSTILFASSSPGTSAMHRLPSRGVALSDHRVRLFTAYK